MDIVFIGSSNFGLSCLQRVCDMVCCNVVGVITAHEKFRISYRPEGVQNVLHADVEGYCRIENIPYVTLDNSMQDEALLRARNNWHPDACLVVGWYHMIPKTWRDLAPAYGLHASLLPDYRGGAPLVWAMINGETETGITLFQMDSRVDTGPIVGQLSEPIFPDDTIATLYERIEYQGWELITQYLPQLANGKEKVYKQDDTKRRLMPQRCPEDGQIDWSRDAEYIDRFVRAQTRPYPGAYSTLEGTVLHIWKAGFRNLEIGINKTGMVIKENDSYWVQCGQGSLKLLEVEHGGKIYKQQELTKIFLSGGLVLGKED